MDAHQYLLDTNILSNLIRHPDGAVKRHLEAIFPQTACTSIVVSAEIHFGLNKGASEKLRRQALQILDALDILPLKTPVDEFYGDIRAYLNRMGLPIGGNDLWIAAHARALDLTLVTANLREFSRVPGLRVEKWLAPIP
jgi:tRNA(fMet)-specific endonuclease VapC